MRVCDLCNGALGIGAKRYSARQIQAAVRKGLRPADGIRKMAALLGVQESVWLAKVMADTTDWAVCPACASRVEQYLLPLKYRKFYGKTVEEARAAAENSGITPDKIQELKVTSVVQTLSAEGRGMDKDGAINAAKSAVPVDAFDVTEPKIIQTGINGILEIQSLTDTDIHQKWQNNCPKDATLNRLECTIPPSNGFLGVNKKPGTWKVYWSVPFKAQISYKKPAEVTVGYI